MALFVYKCHQGHVTEHLRTYDHGDVLCPECRTPAERQYGGFKTAALVPREHDMRNDFRRFREATAETDYAASKIEANTGAQLQTPNHWANAKAKAAAIVAAGESTVRPGPR